MPRFAKTMSKRVKRSKIFFSRSRHVLYYGTTRTKESQYNGGGSLLQHLTRVRSKIQDTRSNLIGEMNL
jgi:hypothetical protein